MKLNYSLIDVFTTKHFGGNQLAVFTDEHELPTEFMQKIARELNLSETVFVLPGKKPNSKKLRIFTPGTELPMAGHPTIGTAFILAKEGLIKTDNGITTFIFEENVGEIEVSIFKDNGEITKTEMVQPLPIFKNTFTDRDLVAELLSLNIDDLDADKPIQTVTAGIPFLYVPVKSLKAMNNIQFRLDVWNQSFAPHEDRKHIFVFSNEVVHDKSTVHSRMFAPAMGIPEDPATGSASGPLGAYLVKYHMVKPNDKQEYHIRSEQGIEMNRPSFIDIKVASENKSFQKVSIGGPSIKVGKGLLELEVE